MKCLDGADGGKRSRGDSGLIHRGPGLYSPLCVCTCYGKCYIRIEGLDRGMFQRVCGCLGRARERELLYAVNYVSNPQWEANSF